MPARVAAGVSKSDDVFEDASSESAGGSVGSSEDVSSSYPDERPEKPSAFGAFGNKATRDVRAAFEPL